MPKIIIKEIDNTKAGLPDYANFSVVVPGLFSGDTTPECFNLDGIYEVSDKTDFMTNIGDVAPTEVTIVNEEGTSIVVKSFGNQIAQKLLDLGYTVLYVNLGSGNSDKVTLSLQESVKNFTTDGLLAPLKDKANYDYRFLLTGLMFSNPATAASSSTIGQDTQKAVNTELAKIAAFVDGSEDSMRGDCTALLDVCEYAYTTAVKTKTTANIINAIRGDILKYDTLAADGKYAAFFAPTFCIDGSNNRWPASLYYLACLAHSVRDLNFAEWYAAAGLTRGKAAFSIVSTSVDLGEIAINALEPRSVVSLSGGSLYKRSVNVIARFRDSYYLWGNRTAYTLDEDLVASHFMNIRQLCTTLKKELYVACRRFTFDPNSDVLWINFCNAIRPTLEAMKADQGIANYEIIKVATSNKSGINQKAILKALVRIVPIEAVEDFDITVSLEDSLGSTGVSVTE